MDAEPPPFFSPSSWDWKAGGGGGALELGRGSPAHSLSPSPSFDSYASSSPYPLLLDVPGGGSSGGSEAGGSLLRGYPLGEFPSSAVYLSRAGLGPGAKGVKGRMSVQRRRKASEREKLRMRTLAEALHTLRDYLPPGYTQRGQPLTKIQTLKCTIKYIGDLTDLLNAVKQGQRP